MNDTSRTGTPVQAGDNVPPGRIRISRFLYAVLALLFAACIVVQVLFAGMGIFKDAADWELHRAFVLYFDKIPLVLFVLSFVGGIRGSLRWWGIGLFAMSSLQYVTALAFADVWMVAVWHPVNALLMFAVALYLTRRSRGWLSGIGR
ncbi:DUF6220 domain-containing protein [Paenibacillus flagellatus]|nr:DUF6220 domain-containing protein [Paenibacillus flagellatus]